MIVINNKKFARNDSEFTDSLFENGGTCVGYYKPTKRGIQLMDHQKTLFAFVVNNRHNEQFFVSAGRNDDGRIRYSYALTSKDERFLGMDSMRYGEKISLAEKLIEGVTG